MSQEEQEDGGDMFDLPSIVQTFNTTDFWNKLVNNSCKGSIRDQLLVQTAEVIDKQKDVIDELDDSLTSSQNILNTLVENNIDHMSKMRTIPDWMKTLNKWSTNDDETLCVLFTFGQPATNLL